MYLIGKGHTHEGPGTSMVQRINWTGAQERQLGRGMGTVGGAPEFWSDCKTMGGRAGLGCGCTAPCSQCGLGLFDSMDPTTWTWQEWFVVGLGGYVVVSMFFTSKRAARQVSEGVGKRVRRSRRKLAAKIAGE